MSKADMDSQEVEEPNLRVDALKWEHSHSVPSSTTLISTPAISRIGFTTVYLDRIFPAHLSETVSGILQKQVRNLMLLFQSLYVL